MLNSFERLRPAQSELRRTAHDQDLVEVPKRARLDREAEGREIPLPSPTTKDAATH